MLIASHRHREKDLELWREHETADRAVHIERRIEEAAIAIKAFVQCGPCYAGVSWGKDSVVVAHLLWTFAQNVPLMHLRPTSHNPDCDAVRNAYFAKHAGQSYDEVYVDYTHLDRIALTDEAWDRETDRQWYATIRAYARSFRDRHILGIRGQESTGRRFRMMRWGLNSPNSCAPIGRWTTDQVFAYLAQYDLPVHPAYACLGGGRWPRERLRVAEIGDTHGKGGGRREWEREYYGDVLRRLESQGKKRSSNANR